jgi:hypothetical protein
MKRTIMLASIFALVGALAFAHGGFDHVRGVVTAITAKAITVKTTDKSTKTLTLDDKTTVKKADKAALVSDIKVGDRVVIDVPEKKTNAVLIQIGVSATATTQK